MTESQLKVKNILTLLLEEYIAEMSDMDLDLLLYRLRNHQEVTLKSGE